LPTYRELGLFGRIITTETRRPRRWRRTVACLDGAIGFVHFTPQSSHFRLLGQLALFVPRASDRNRGTVGYWNGGVSRPAAHWLCLHSNLPTGYRLPTTGYRHLALFFRELLDTRILITLCVSGSYDSKRSHRNWVCFARLSISPTTDYRLLPFGFVWQNRQGTGTVEHWNPGYSPSPLGLFVQLSTAP
jgi:hypothetical protein